MIVIVWLLIGICDCVIFWDSTGSRASLSAKPADYFSGFYFYNKFPKYYQSVFGGQRIIPVGSDWSYMSDEIYPKVILL